MAQGSRPGAGDDSAGPEVPKPVSPILVISTPPQFPVSPNAPGPANEPPPPYRDRRTRQSARSARWTGQSSDAHTADETDDIDGETAPLLAHSPRPRTISHSSNALSTHSLAHNVFSLFQAEDSSPHLAPPQEPSTLTRIGRYFRPLIQREYYSALFHLFVLNFPFAILTWVYLLVATFAGAALLLALPLGALLCWLALFGGRVASRMEISMQTTFHGPLAQEAPNHPRFWRSLPPDDTEGAVPGSVQRQSFLKSTYAMFVDPVSYQNLFYFLVVKPAVTLLIFLGICVLVPTAFGLVLPAPAVLRATKKIGIIQANIALESLS